MTKAAIMLMLLVKGLVVSGYFAFFHSRPKQVNLQPFEGSHMRKYLVELNRFAREHPNPSLDSFMVDLDWIIRNQYERDLRVRRLVHQDLKSLVEITRLYDTLERDDNDSHQVYHDALSNIAARMNKLRHTKDQAIRDEILLLGDMIQRNNK
jgi:hypothetical protein